MDTEKKIKSYISKNKSQFPLGLSNIVVKSIEKQNHGKAIPVSLYETDRYPVFPFFKHISRIL